MGNVIGVLSGKGGVGKTTTVANLGAALTNNFNKSVIVFDTNLKTSHLGLHFGMYEDPTVTLKDVLKNKVSIHNAVYTHPQTGIRIVPAPLGGDDTKVSDKKISSILKSLKQNYELVIMDASPGLGIEAVSAIRASDKIIVVTTPDLPAVTDAVKTVSLARKMKKEVIGLVVNRTTDERYELTNEEIESMCNATVIKKIRDDKRIPESVTKGVPVVISNKYSNVANDFNQLAGYISGEEYVRRGFFEKFKNLFGR